MNRQAKKIRSQLNFYFSTAIFLITLASLVLVGGCLLTLNSLGILPLTSLDTFWGTFVFLIINAVACLILGAGLTALFIRILLKPIFRVVEGMAQLASGNYKERVELGKSELSRTVADSFNTLASELENTKILRSDFVNNFSHEFKTPIVSIAGFAKLLKRGKLTEEEKTEYLDIIEEESLRLSSMATQVLDLSRVENQAALTDVTEYNLSEQLRTCALLLENQWTGKNIDLRVDLEEHQIYANEEQLRQVWINLLDNAIKYSPEGGIVEITVEDAPGRVRVSVCNTGTEIPPEYREKIFHKFYQVDESHSGKGNGIGLAIVKRVVELHRGNVEVDCADGRTTFTVELPTEQ